MTVAARNVASFHSLSSHSHYYSIHQNTHTHIHSLFILDRQIDEDEEPDLDLDMGHNVVQRDSSVVNLDDVNVMMDTVIDTVLSNELKGMATEFMGKVRSMVDGEDGCPVPDKNTETETIHSENDAVSKLR